MIIGDGMPNMRKIAELAGVSIATVSRYINNNGYVSDEVREKIQKIIDEENYRPNELARSIFRKSSKTIGLMVPNISNPFFNQMALIIEKYANDKGYSVFLCNTEDNSDKEKKYIDILQSHRVAGIIIARSQCKEEYASLDVPIIAFENHISENIITVSTDNYEGGRIAFEHLYQSGCRNILHVKGPSAFEATQARCKGFFDAAKDVGLNIDTFEFETDFQVKMLEGNMGDINKISTYDGIFVFNDIAAAVIMKFLATNHRNIPKDVQIIGFDNSFISKVLQPSLTTINQPVQEIGKMMIKLLIKLIENKRVEVKDYIFKPELIKRETTK